MGTVPYRYTVTERATQEVVARNLSSTEVVERFIPEGEQSAALALIHSLTLGKRVTVGTVEVGRAT
jgi:hypothetical protein